jgi:hypothetical protein
VDTNYIIQFFIERMEKENAGWKVLFLSSMVGEIREPKHMRYGPVRRLAMLGWRRRLLEA